MISPNSIDRLYRQMMQANDLVSLQLLLPEEHGAAARMASAIATVDTFLGGRFGDSSRRHTQLGVLLNQWMRGRPLSYLINDRATYLRGVDPKFNLASTIRSVMSDVEEMARFQAPLYLSCYADILRLVMEVRGRTSDQPTFPDIAMMLELGVSRTTELSMMSLGLSRTSVVALSDLIVADDLTAADCVAWLRQATLAGLGLPVLVLREIESALERYSRREAAG